MTLPSPSHADVGLQGLPYHPIGVCRPFAEGLVCTLRFHLLVALLPHLKFFIHDSSYPGRVETIRIHSGHGALLLGLLQVVHPAPILLYHPEADPIFPPTIALCLSWIA